MIPLSSFEGLVSVVIPAYNEEELVSHGLAETVAVLDQLDCRYEVILVDDGSNDGTLDRARETAESLGRVRVIGSEVNLGKGSAVVRGAHAALGEVVLFLDADLEVHPRQLAMLWDLMVQQNADVVIGSKLHPQSQVDYPLSRRILSYGYYVLVRLLFRLPVHDTQTGLKLFRREPLVRVLPRLLVKRFAFDLELLINLHRDGCRIVEAPVSMTRVRDYPRLGPRDVWFVAVDTAAIWYRRYLVRYYDRRAAETISLLDAAEPFDIKDAAELMEPREPGSAPRSNHADPTR